MQPAPFPPAEESRSSPMFDRLCVLLVEDSDNDALILKKTLEKECVSFRAVRVQNRGEMEAALAAEVFEAILCDHDMPEFSASAALDVRNARCEDLPFIIVTGAIGGEEIAIDLMRRGVSDFVAKSNLARLLPALKRELREAAAREAKRDADEALRRTNSELQATVETLKGTQAELVRAGRMKGLGRMAASISHDMGNALNRAVGLLDRFEREGGGLETVRDAIDQASRVVKRLTYFCDVHPRHGLGTPVDLGRTIAGSLEACRHRFQAEGGESGIEVVSHFRDVPPVLGDEDQFRDAITSLILNACDSMPDGGRLRISSFRNTGGVVVEIEDDGVGMSAETLHRNLESFFEEEGDPFPSFDLAWINALQERYGGILRVDSTEGLGTKFHLRFTICESGSSHPGDETAGFDPHVDSDGGKGGLHILAVDDEEVIASCIAAFLRDEGHRVQVARSGYEALEKLRENRFDVVVSDRAMKDFSGEELAKRLRERGSGEKFVLATGSGDLLIANCQRIEGVDVILPKPITRDALRRSLTQAGFVGEVGRQGGRSASTAGAPRSAPETDCSDAFAFWNNHE